jgi:hypothetical protein
MLTYLVSNSRLWLPLSQHEVMYSHHTTLADILNWLPFTVTISLIWMACRLVTAMVHINLLRTNGQNVGMGIVNYNMSGLLINSRDMLGGRVFWDFVCGSASSHVAEGASLLRWVTLVGIVCLCFFFSDFVIYHQIFINVGSVAALIVVAWRVLLDWN